MTSAAPGERRPEWDDPATTYLDTASYGLPPTQTWIALQSALEEWRTGVGAWEQWCSWTDRARSAFASLVETVPERVAVGAGVSPLVSIVAGGLPARSRVLAAEEDFNSLLWPFAVRSEIDLELVPARQLAKAVSASTTLVAVSAVQSRSGELADLGAIRASASHHGAMTCIDATQACGWLPLRSDDWTFLIAAGYKWLCSPRGTAFMTVQPESLEALLPVHANWFAAASRHSVYYGASLELADDARRLDTSPAWFSWVGAAPALELLNSIGIGHIHEHNVGLANRFRLGAGLAPSNSAIVSVHAAGAAACIGPSGIRTSVREGGLRLSFHIYNRIEDVDLALDALKHLDLRDASAPLSIVAT